VRVRVYIVRTDTVLHVRMGSEITVRQNIQSFFVSTHYEHILCHRKKEKKTYVQSRLTRRQDIYSIIEYRDIKSVYTVV
jgi:hypothetical protein